MPAPRGATRHAGEHPPTGAAQQSRAAYNHGKAGRNAPEWVLDDPNHARAYSNGQNDATPPATDPVAQERTPADDAPTTNTPAPGGSSLGGRPSSGAGSAGGVLLGTLTYAVLINYLRGGAPQVRAWFGAKFTNKTPGAAIVGANTVAPAAPGRRG